MVLTEEPKYWFYPDIQGNLNLPESERLAVEIIRPTGFQSKEFVSVKSTREFYRNDQPLDADGNAREVKKFKSVTTELCVNADYILRECVGQVRNLSVKDGGGKERQIKSGSELADCRAYGIAEIVSAVCNEVRSDVPTDSKKKSLE